MADVGRVSTDAERTDLGSATSQLLVVFWIMVGAAAGALAAGLFARRQRRLTRREHMIQLRRREGAIERLKTTLQEHTARLKRRDEQLRELAALRAERAHMAAELEQARRTVSELQSEAESARSQAREVELRLTLDLDRERHEHASRRASGSAELASAQ
jgi:chromosome segregation ATPase